MASQENIKLYKGEFWNIGAQQILSFSTFYAGQIEGRAGRLKKIDDVCNYNTLILY